MGQWCPGGLVALATGETGRGQGHTCFSSPEGTHHLPRPPETRLTAPARQGGRLHPDGVQERASRLGVARREWSPAPLRYKGFGGLS